MPLSEHEQRLLEQMERALYAEDPKFATSLRSGPSGRASRGRAAAGVLILIAGIVTLMAGVVVPLIPLGVAGFVVMVIGAFLIYSGLRARPPEAAAEGEVAGSPGAGAGKAAKPAKGLVLDS